MANHGLEGPSHNNFPMVSFGGKIVDTVAWHCASVARDSYYRFPAFTYRVLFPVIQFKSSAYSILCISVPSAFVQHCGTSLECCDAQTYDSDSSNDVAAPILEQCGTPLSIISPSILSSTRVFGYTVSSGARVHNIRALDKKNSGAKHPPKQSAITDAKGAATEIHALSKYSANVGQYPV
ncbi:hypothetical protein M5K25_004241 [Dendrobium thyrsiflorum]|uniref:Uncharacterized protein n=1 Tax=Dendrobium thyrsiflorum TaxID=117978 RepID=A0ABD0VTP7_DENTH